MSVRVPVVSDERRNTWRAKGEVVGDLRGGLGVVAGGRGAARGGVGDEALELVEAGDDVPRGEDVVEFLLRAWSQ